MLQVVAVSFVDLTVNGLLHPNEFLDKLVVVAGKEVQSKLVLVVDYPDEQKAVGLELLKRNTRLVDVLVGECVVVGCHTTSGVASREDPWRIHRDHVEKTASVLQLSLGKPVEEVVLLDVRGNRDAKLLVKAFS